MQNLTTKKQSEIFAQIKIKNKIFESWVRLKFSMKTRLFLYEIWLLLKAELKNQKKLFETKFFEEYSILLLTIDLNISIKMLQSKDKWFVIIN